MGQSRNENILENMLGASNPLGEPQSREEALLMQLLEKISGGGGSSAFVINITENDGEFSADKTYNEIQSAFNNGDLLFINLKEKKMVPLNYRQLIESGTDNYAYNFVFIEVSDGVTYITDTHITLVDGAMYITQFTNEHN